MCVVLALIPTSNTPGVYFHMSCIGICRCEGYGFQAVHSRIGYMNQSAWV